jgi:hypothetical protein
MKVTLTLKRIPSLEDVSFIESSLREIHRDIAETSRDGLSISFAAPTTDLDPFGDLFQSWLSSPESIMEGFHMVADL